MKSESRSVNDMIKENGSVSQSIELLTKKDQTYIDYLDNNLWPKQKKFIDDGCFTRDKSLEITIVAVSSLQPSSIEMLIAAAVKEESFRNILLFIIGKHVRQ